jgi:hypothetical protein
MDPLSRQIPPRKPLPNVLWNGNIMFFGFPRKRKAIPEWRQKQAFRCACHCGCGRCDACIIGTAYYQRETSDYGVRQHSAT